jgi:hypothetical protein
MKNNNNNNNNNGNNNNNNNNNKRPLADLGIVMKEGIDDYCGKYY